MADEPEIQVVVPQKLSFTKVWTMMLAKTMVGTHKGYRKSKTNRHSGKGKDRREDKLDGTPKRFRQYSNRRGVDS